MKQFEQETGHQIILKPILLGALFKKIGTPMVPLFAMSSDKQQAVFKDLGRWAEWWKIPFSFPSHFPLRSVLPLRAAIVEPSLTIPLYTAFWAKGQDISKESVILDICNQHDLDGQSVIEDAQSQTIKDLLRQNTQIALDSGVCGVPSWDVNGEIWWGQDRLLSLASRLA